MHFGTEEEQRVLGMLPVEQAQAAFLHAQTLDEASRVMLNRTLSYGTVWERQGALKNLLKAETKMGRLMAAWFANEGEYPALHKDALDDALDLINYVAFFIQCARAGNITGDASLNAQRDRELASLIQRVRGWADAATHPGEHEDLHKIADQLDNWRTT